MQKANKFFSFSFLTLPAVVQPLLPGVIAAAISALTWQMGAWQPLEQLGYNTLFQVRETGILGNSDWDDRVVVIAIDEASIRKYGRFPWTRNRYTQLLQSLKTSPPAVVGFDILFSEYSANDADFAQVMLSSRNVVLAWAGDEQGKILKPVPVLEKASASLGHILHTTDKDGISRKATIFINQFPGLGVAMLQVDQLGNSLTPSRSEFRLPQPVEGEKAQQVLINWPSQTQAAATYSFADVVEGKVDKSAFAKKLVLVGITTTGSDPLVSPLNQTPPTAGVYLHAAVIDNLLNDRLLQLPPSWLTLLSLFAVGSVTSWLLSKQGPKRRLVLACLLPIVWFGLALLLFSWNHWWIATAAPIGTMILTSVGLQLREQKEKQQLMSLFAKHVAPETAQLIWHNKDQIFQDGELTAQEMTATVLFMDIRGFTTISEGLAPRELLLWLNQYLDVMTACIMDNGGVIDKYIGDAIMAVFGIPFPHTKHEDIQQDALNAVAAGIEMYEKLEQLNERFSAEGKPMIRFGIGIHTGPVIAGSVGGSRRLNYSVLGDTVNVAARLEAMNKEAAVGNPYNLLITGETFTYIREQYHARPVISLQLRGRERETLICAILGKK